MDCSRDQSTSAGYGGALREGRREARDRFLALGEVKHAGVHPFSEAWTSHQGGGDAHVELGSLRFKGGAGCSCARRSSPLPLDLGWLFHHVGHEQICLERYFLCALHAQRGPGSGVSAGRGQSAGADVLPDRPQHRHGSALFSQGDDRFHQCRPITRSNGRRRTAAKLHGGGCRADFQARGFEVAATELVIVRVAQGFEMRDMIQRRMPADTVSVRRASLRPGPGPQVLRAKRCPVAATQP